MQGDNYFAVSVKDPLHARLIVSDNCKIAFYFMYHVRNKSMTPIVSCTLTASHTVVSDKVLCQFYAPYFEMDVCRLERVGKTAKFKKYDYQGKMENLRFDESVQKKTLQRR